MRVLSCDIETFSSVDLLKAGMHKYVESPDFEVLLLAWAFDDDPVQLVDLKQGEELPFFVRAALFQTDTINAAYNAAFEWCCLAKHFGLTSAQRETWLSQWRCTLLHGLYCGYPGSLGAISEAIGLPADKKKLTTGKALIRTFCVPTKPTKSNGQRTRTLPHHEPERWEAFKIYCMGDVEAERAVARKLKNFPVPPEEQLLWEYDVLMNADGVGLDMELVNSALAVSDRIMNELQQEAVAITGVENPKSVQQLVGWLSEEMDENIKTLRKDDVTAMIERLDEGKAKRVLELRQEMSKTSVRKYAAMKTCVCADGRGRGFLQHYGANRTGRYCLAEGTPIVVKTQTGEITEKAIESVSLSDLLWDGEAWVSHEGVVFSGEKETIAHKGLRATPEHIVWVSPDNKMPLGEAKAKRRKLWRGKPYIGLTKMKISERWKKTLAETNRRKLVQTVKTYDIINAGPNNRFLTKYGIVSNSGRIVQVQNLPRNYIQTLDHARDCIKARKLDALKLIYGNVPDTLSQLIRTAFVPSEGNSFAIADFSAIEARVVAWLAQERWVMDVFASHGKIYEATAAQMFNVPLEEVNKELRQRGKVAVLGLGYGMGAPRLKETAEKSYRVFFTDEESEDIVGKWRKANPSIVQLWHDVGNAAIDVVKYGGWQRVGFIELYAVHDPGADLTFLKIRLPNGRELYYPKPHLTLNRWGRDEIQFWGVDDKKKWNLIKTYGAKLVENCLGEDTLILTNSGWKRIVEVSSSDMLWDGEKWCSHDGLVNKGVQNTICVDGVWCTPDHKILTERGWTDAKDTEGLIREKVGLPGGAGLRGFKRKKENLERTLRLRKDFHYDLQRHRQNGTEVLRVQEERNDWCRDQNTRNEQTPRICGVAVNARPLPPTHTSSLGKLWRAGDIRLRTLGRLIRKLLGRHGADLSARAYPRTNRCKWELHPRKLHLGDYENPSSKQTQKHHHNHGPGYYDRGRNRRKIGNWSNHTPLQIERWSIAGTASRYARHAKPVYDILNAGNLQRFTVLGDTGPMLVHNCTQAVARDCLTHSLIQLTQQGYRIVFHVHDEVVIECKSEEAEAVLQHALAVMAAPIPWAPGLVLGGAGFTTEYYQKD